jgi:predicted DNA-binding protein
MEPEATQQTAFRLPLSLLARLDRYAERMRGEQKGLGVTRADVVRILLTKALDELGISSEGT